MTTTTAAGATPLAARALGPDLARGFMLLFIALANSHYFLPGDSHLGGFPRDVSPLDSVITWLIATFVDGRAFPMFGLLFGYGVAHIVRRQEAAGRRAVRHLLWRRALVLVGVGVVDGFLFYEGDILAMYGVLLLVGAWAVFWRDRWLVGVAGAIIAIGALPSGDSMSISADGPGASALPPDFLTQVSERAVVVPFVALLGPIGFAAPYLIGLWAGRHRILEQPERHRALLATVAAVGIGAAVLGAQPVALMLAGVTAVPDSRTLELIGPLHDATGVLGGFGYAALVTLVAPRLSGHRSRVVAALAATGQRSMTCYLAQSVTWALVFTPYLLGLADDLTVTTTALLATATWLGTVVLADRMGRQAYRGPFELLVRRVTYR